MQQKHIVGALVGILVIGALVFVVRSEADIAGYPPTRGTTIVAFGDSLVEGVGSTAGNDLVSRLSQMIGVPIINAGKSGDTTTMARERFERDVLARDPRVVFILLGGNDFLKRVPREETFSNLRAMITMLHERGTMVVLLGVRGGLLGDSYEKDFDALAHETRVLYVPNVLEDIIGDETYLADAIHPNDSGYARIAGRVYGVVESYQDAFQVAGE